MIFKPSVPYLTYQFIQNTSNNNLNIAKIHTELTKNPLRFTQARSRTSKKRCYKLQRWQLLVHQRESAPFPIAGKVAIYYLWWDIDDWLDNDIWCYVILGITKTLLDLNWLNDKVFYVAFIQVFYLQLSL